jgi:hypothetical protein
MLLTLQKECGVHLFGDFNISSRTQKRRLLEFLAWNSHSPNGTIHASSNSQQSSFSQFSNECDLGTFNSTSSTGNSSINTITSTISAGLGIGTNQTTTTQSQAGRPNKYLALCVNTGRFHSTLGEINITSIIRDNEAFRIIKKRYLEIRGFRARARRLFLVSPSSVHFVKVCHSQPLQRSSLIASHG